MKSAAGIKENLRKLASLDLREAAEICGGAGAASLIFFASAGFLFYCAVCVREECVMPRTAVSSAAADEKVVAESRRRALDRVLYEDFRKQAREAAAKDRGLLFSPVSSFVFVDGSARRLPDYVPTVTLKALALLGGESVCILDVDGEAPGSLFGAGDTFGGGRGKIIGIEEKGVRWKWGEKEFFTGL